VSFALIKVNAFCSVRNNILCKAAPPRSERFRQNSRVIACFCGGEGGRPTGILGRTVREMANKRDAFEEEIGQKKQFQKKANEIVIANFLDRLSVTSVHRVPQSSQA